jgi:hypothetical protein
VHLLDDLYPNDKNQHVQMNVLIVIRKLYANYSKESCLARNCLFDDGAHSGVIQCYLSPNYGYILQGSEEQIKNGIRLKLKRNSAVGSMFPQPMENVLLDVQYYTNDIIRFKLYDADNQRYEVREKKE